MRDLAAILKRNPQLSIAPGSMTLPTDDSDDTPTATIERPAQPVQAIPWPSERAFQAAVIAERDRRAVYEPVYGLLYHISNENAHRNPGVLGGVPDLCLALPRGRFGACYVELKAGASALAGRTRLVIKNPSIDTAVRIGGSEITTKRGYLLEPQGTVTIEQNSATAVAVYGRSTGWEVSLEVLEA